MAILYRLTVNNPNFGTVQNWPPQVIESSWHANYASKLHSIANNVTTREVIFADVNAFETWVNSNRLTDSGLVSALNDWKSAHGITYSEEFYELPAYTPSITGLLG